MICPCAPAAPLAAAAESTPDAVYNKEVFERKLYELGLQNDFSMAVMSGLPTSFAWYELAGRPEHVEQERREQLRPDPATASGIRALAEANYEICYPEDFDLSERVVFPRSPVEANGIEDA